MVAKAELFRVPVWGRAMREAGFVSVDRSGNRTQALQAMKSCAEAVERRLEAIREAARGSENLLPVLREALKDRCTMGEVCGAMRDVFGEYQPTF